MKQLQAMILAVAALVAAQANAEIILSEETIIENIKPVAEVCLQGDDSCGGPAVAVASGPRSGADIFGTYCTACHTAGVGGAPKNGDKAAWDARLAKGMDKTLATAKNGINAMPAMGLCGDCSDEELTDAINHMAGR